MRLEREVEKKRVDEEKRKQLDDKQRKKSEQEKQRLEQEKKERAERKKERERLVILGSVLEETETESTNKENQKTKPNKTESRREHLKRRFEHANLDTYLDKDPLDRVIEKYRRGVFAKRHIAKNEFIAFHRGEVLTEDQFDQKSQAHDIEYVFYSKSWKTYIDAKN